MEDNQEIIDPNQLDLFANIDETELAEINETAEVPADIDVYTSPELLGWNSIEEQEALFFALLLFYDPESSILDVGAGRGDLYGYMSALYQDQWDPSLYSGIDYNSYLIGLGKEKFPNANLEVGDLFTIDETVRYDWCMANGVFNLKIANYDMDEYTKLAIDKMYTIADKGIAFNLLTSYDDSMSQEVIDAIHKFDAGEYLNYLTEKYGKVICRADYFPGDVTFFIFK